MASRIDHLVVLMMENRSFDHMLGFMKSAAYPIEGLTGLETNPPLNGNIPVQVNPYARTSGDLNPDPDHDFISVNVQITGNQQGTPGSDLMKGFVSDYSTLSGDPTRGAQIMNCFNEHTLPVLSTLAGQYAICDHWFSSVPGPTIPNRMFAHGATSLGSVVQDPLCYDLKTIFEVIDSDAANRNDYRIYHHGAQTILLSVRHLIEDQHGFREYNQFVTDCSAADLPAYTFIEPRYSDERPNGSLYPANDQHPNHDVAEGEQLIREVYTAIRNNPTLWQSTLLLIVYDEHGGIFDHVTPPSIAPPWVSASPDPPFQFDRLGVRVPALFVSAYISPGTIVSTQFEHSSIVATVRKLFAPNAQPLSERDKSANTFETVLNRTEARDDIVTFPRADANFASHLARLATAPVQRRPSELAVTMARVMNDTLSRRGLTPRRSVQSIHMAEDASEFMRSAAEQLSTGAAKAPTTATAAVGRSAPGVDDVAE